MAGARLRACLCSRPPSSSTYWSMNSSITICKECSSSSYSHNTRCSLPSALSWTPCSLRPKRRDFTRIISEFLPRYSEHSFTWALLPFSYLISGWMPVIKSSTLPTSLPWSLSLLHTRYTIYISTHKITWSIGKTCRSRALINFDTTQNFSEHNPNA